MASPTSSPPPELSTVSHDVPRELVEPFHYLCKYPGKAVRSQLIAAFNAWLEVPADRIREVKAIIEQLHTASLLIDDIEDNSKLRRGVPVAHAVYGVPVTINAANYVYFVALQHVHNLGSPAALTAFVEEMLLLHRGQGHDISWRERNACPTEAEYETMVKDKTGGLFRLAVKLMLAFSSSARRDELMPLVNDLGLYFQVQDDLLNVSSAEYQHNKQFCEDVSEGKFSFPIIHAIRADPQDHRLLNILRRRTEDHDIKQHAVDIMREAGSFEHTRAALARIELRIRQQIAALGGNPALEAIVDKLVVRST